MTKANGFDSKLAKLAEWIRSHGNEAINEGDQIIVRSEWTARTHDGRIVSGASFDVVTTVQQARDLLGY